MSKHHIPYKLNNQKGNEISFSLPHCWEGVTLAQYEAILALKVDDLFDNITYLEILSGIKREVWEQSDEFDVYFTATNNLQFLMDATYLDSLEASNKFTYQGIEREIPKDISIYSIGQYKDMIKFCIEPMIKKETTIQQVPYIPLMIAIYLQPVFETRIVNRFRNKLAKYDFGKAKELCNDIKENISVVDAIKVSAFFLSKPLRLKQDSQGFVTLIMNRMKSMLGLSSYVKDGAFI